MVSFPGFGSYHIGHIPVSTASKKLNTADGGPTKGLFPLAGSSLSTPESALDFYWHYAYALDSSKKVIYLYPTLRSLLSNTRPADSKFKSYFDAIGAS